MYVYYGVKGSAVSGIDYRRLRGGQLIKAGQTSASVRIVAQGDLDGEARKTVEITLEASADYDAGSNAAAEVEIVPAK